MKFILLFISVWLFNISTIHAQEIYRLKNRWKSDEYVHVEQPVPATGTIQPGWLSAQWTFEPVAGTGYYTIKNVWRNQYLHIQNAALESGTIQPGWWSAHWSLEPVDGTSFYRIRNRWKPEVALHNQNGRLEAGPIDLGWWSAQWETVRSSSESTPVVTMQQLQQQATSDTERRSNNPGAFTPEHGGRIATAIVRYDDQIHLGDNVSPVKGSKIYFFKQEVVVFKKEGLSFDSKNPAIGGQEFIIVETEPKLKLNKPMPMMRNDENSYFSFVVEVY